MSVTREQMEKELAELEALYPSSSNQDNNSNSSRDAMERELSELERLYPNKKEGFTHRLKQFARGIASDIGQESDIGPPGSPMLNAIYPSDYEGIYAKSTVPMSEELPRALGLGKEYEPEENDTLGKIVNFGGKMIRPSSLLPLPFGGYGILGNAIGKGSKTVSKALGKELGIIGAQSAAIKGTPRLTEEGTGLGFLEDLSKGAIAGQLTSIKSPIKLPKLNRNEKAVHNYISGIVGEENIPGILERLRIHKENPSVIGYEPFTSEVAGNPGFAQLQRGLEGVAGYGLAEKEAEGARKIAEALKNSKLSEDDMSSIQQYFINRLGELEHGVHTESQALSPKLNETESGESLQNALVDTLNERKGERRAAVKPLYEKVKEMKGELNPENALKYIDEELETAVGGPAKDLMQFKGMFKGNGITKKDIEYRKSYENTIKQIQNAGGEAAVQQYLQKAPKPKDIHPSISKLVEIKKELRSKIKEYKLAGKDNQARILSGIKRNLEKDLQNIPEQAEATRIYREMSEPVSAITENKALNSVTKSRNNNLVMSPSRIPGVFINNTAGSIDDSRSLLRELQNKPGALNDIRSYLNNLASIEIINPDTGLVNINKLDSFKKKYPGAKVLYPDLYDTKLKDIKSSQMMVDRFLKNTESVSNTIYKDALGNYAGKDSSKVIKDIFRGDSGENMSRLLSEFNGDETLIKALQNETIDYFKKSITNAGSVGQHNKLSYPKTQKFLKEHEKALEQVLTENQLDVVKEIGEITASKNYSATEGMSKNSHTHANIRNALDFSKKSGYSMAALKAILIKIGVATPFAKEFFKDMRDIQVQKNEQILARALREPDYAEYLLSTPLRSKKDFFDFIDKSNIYSKSRYVPPELLDLIREQEEE